MTEIHSADVSDDVQSVLPAIAADEAQQLPCSADGYFCHINRNECQLITSGETGVLSDAIEE